MTHAPFVLLNPKQRSSSVVFASPHSGRNYTPVFLSSVQPDPHAIRSSEDAFVDLLFESAPESGCPLLLAQVPRAMVDLNRGHDELDPAVIEGVRRAAQNPRVVSGLGVIPRVVANGRAIYHGKISMAEAHARIRDVWHPYHDALQALLDESVAMFGDAVLIDCHSMPREALEVMGHTGLKTPEIVLGDRFGAAASPRIVEKIESAFVAAGFRVSRNIPFAGAYSATAYGRPSRRQHAVQIEIDRSLYMDEKRIEPLPHFEEFRARLAGVIDEIAGIGRKEVPLAAE